MKSLILIFTTSTSVFLSANSSSAGWTPDVRLTDRRFEIYPQVVARNDTVHIAWQQIAGTKHVSYLRSTDGGNVWSELRNLEDTATHYGVRQDLWLTPDYVFVGWEDVVPQDISTNIGYTHSTDGADWDAPHYIFPHGIELYDLGTAAFRDSIYAVYFSTQHDSTHINPLRFLYSSDMGATWSNEITVGHVGEYTNFLHMAHCKNSLYVVWAGTPAPLGFYREVMAVVSHDGGQTWSDVMQLSSPDTAAAQLTCIACDEESGNFAVGWMDAGSWNHYPGDLSVRITSDGGYSWMPESHATYDRWVMCSSLAIKGDSLWAAWDDHDPAFGRGNPEICFSRSTDLGASWSSYERLTYAPGYSASPGIAYDNGKFHVVWYDDNPPPDSGMDIYYKRYEPEVGIGNEGKDNLPDKINLSAYPNPFNSSTIIKYSGVEGGEIEIYNINGQLISKLGTEQNLEGQINWDATDASGERVSSGIYFARARASQNSQVLKLIYLK